mmetsp:Transcript_837/g.2796  ORF Transcript_837/g.2796 Transcript_837/m.2796 type:complete len:267 (-) Transcript_837:152-952(-)
MGDKMADVNTRLEDVEKQNALLKEQVEKLRTALTNAERRIVEVEKAAKAAAADGAAAPAPKQQKKKKKGGGGGGDGGKKDKAAADPKKREKAIKAATKEGGKKAQDLAGMHDMGGMAFFCVTMEQCEGDWELLQCAMTAANRKVDEDADDRKGGADNLAKILMSVDDASTRLCAYVHVPAEQAGKVTAKEWIDATFASLGPKIIEEDGTFFKVECPQNKEKELFPLKMRDLGINQSFAFLRSKNLVPEDDSDDDVGELYEAADIEW